MNRRAFTVLAVAAILLALLAIFAQRSDNSTSIAGDSAGELFLPALADEVDQISQVQISGAGRERLVSLEQIDGAWTVAELGGYAASTASLNGLLIALAEARIVEEKTANPEFFDRLGVEAVDADDATGLEISLRTDGGDSFNIVLGDAYGNGQRYARLAADGQSVLIDRNPEIARAAADWVHPEIIDIAAARVQRVSIMHADGEELVLQKAAPEDSNFTVAAIPEGRELQYASIADVTGNLLAKLTLEEVAAGPAAAATPVAVVEFRTFDGLVVTVTATAADADADADADEPWLSFVASVDADATSPPEDAEASNAADVAAEASAINGRLAGWRYRIPAYKYTQLTRRMDDLLRDLPVTDE